MKNSAEKRKNNSCLEYNNEDTAHGHGTHLI